MILNDKKTREIRKKQFETNKRRKSNRNIQNSQVKKLYSQRKLHLRYDYIKILLHLKIILVNWNYCINNFFSR